MRRVFKISIIFSMLVFSVLIFDSAQAQEQQIRSVYFDSIKINLTVTEDGKIEVKEQFTILNYGEGLSGFFWTISSKNVTDLSVKNGGQSLSPDEYKISQKNNKTIISDFKTNQLFSEWEISYLKKHTIKSKGNLDELRYEFKPDGAMANNLEITVILPQLIQPDQIKPIYYAIHGVTGIKTDISDTSAIHYQIESMGPFSIFTILPNWPKGIISYSIFDKIYNFISSAKILSWVGFGILLPVLGFVVMFTMILIKRLHENIKPLSYPVTNPKIKISPAALGVLYHESVGPREIAATLIDLALRGYIFIVNKGRGVYAFGSRRTPSGMLPAELSLYREIFQGGYKRRIGEIMEIPQKQIFSDAITKIYKQIYKDVSDLGYFNSDPQLIHLRYKILGMILFTISVVGFFTSRLIFPDLPYLIFGFFSMSLTSFIVIRMAQKMPTRTKKGREVLAEWLSFRNFLKKYEKNINYQEIFQNVFISQLPYAVVLNVEAEWANHFVDIPFRMPDWYATAQDSGILTDFTQDLYPLIDYIASLMQSLKEPSVE